MGLVWRGGGIALLIAAGVGSFLPDLTTCADVRTTTTTVIELDGSVFDEPRRRAVRFADHGS